MSTSQGHCTKCNEINTYKSTACVLCGTRLPWASTAARAAALAAPVTAVSETPAVHSQGLSAFFASSPHRYAVLGAPPLRAAGAWWTPAVHSRGLRAFFASSAYRYVVLAVLLFGAAAAVYVVNTMASR